MKLIFKLLLPPLLLLSACKKEFSFEKTFKESFHLNCTIDGIPKTFVKFGAGDHTDPDNGNLSVTGFTDSIPNVHADRFGFEIFSTTKKVVEGEYTDSNPDFQLIGGYTDSVKMITFLAGTPLADLARPPGINISNHFKVVVTSFINNTVRGTFSGDLYKNGDPDGAIISITEGDFYLKMK